MFGSATGAGELGMGGWDVDLDAVVKLERGGVALAVQAILSSFLHVGMVGERETMEGGDGDLDGGCSPFR